MAICMSFSAWTRVSIPLEELGRLPEDLACGLGSGMGRSKGMGRQHQHTGRSVERVYFPFGLTVLEGRKTRVRFRV